MSDERPQPGFHKPLPPAESTESIDRELAERDEHAAQAREAEKGVVSSVDVAGAVAVPDFPGLVRALDGKGVERTFKVLPAGVRRTIRVGRQFADTGKGGAWRIAEVLGRGDVEAVPEEGDAECYESMILIGAASFHSGLDYSVLPCKFRAWLETEGAIYVC